VRFRDSCILAVGVVVDELTRDYVRVQWDGVEQATIHERGGLELIQLA
jgi:hypothetical protein